MIEFLISLQLVMTGVNITPFTDLSQCLALIRMKLYQGVGVIFWTIGRLIFAYSAGDDGAATLSTGYYRDQIIVLTVF